MNIYVWFELYSLGLGQFDGRELTDEVNRSLDYLRAKGATITGVEWLTYAENGEPFLLTTITYTADKVLA